MKNKKKKTTVYNCAHYEYDYDDWGGYAICHCKNNPYDDFYNHEKGELSDSLFNIAHTDAISEIAIEQCCDSYRLAIVTTTNPHDTNITPELMDYLTKVLNKACMRPWPGEMLRGIHPMFYRDLPPCPKHR